jgi:hypothetical protein
MVTIAITMHLQQAEPCACFPNPNAHLEGFTALNAPILRGMKKNLRSWVQLPPGPFLPALEIRYCFEFNLGKCRTNLTVISMQ